MRMTASLVIASFLWTTTFAPAAFAAPAPSDLPAARQQLSQRIDRLEAKGWTMEDASHHRLTSADLLMGRGQDIFLTPPAGTDGAEYRFEARQFPLVGGVMKSVLTVRDTQGRVLSRRLFQMNGTEDAASVRVRLSQTLVSMENDLHTQAAHRASPWQKIWNAILPSAYADTALVLTEAYVITLIASAVVGAAVTKNPEDTTLVMIGASFVFLIVSVVVLMDKINSED